MSATLVEGTTAAIASLSCKSRMGHIIAVAAASIEITGLTNAIRLGDRVEILRGDAPKTADIVRLSAEVAIGLVDGPCDGIAVGDAVKTLPTARFSPDHSWIGRVIDPDGKPLDDMALPLGLEIADLQRGPPAAHQRRALGKRLETGLAVMNTLLPLVRGQRIGLFAGSGVGKSTMLADLARGVEADVVVIALVGERGRELRDFVEDVLGPEGMRRTVVIAATSDRTPQIRRRCAQAATATAEYFRDQGLHVLLLVDSITRFCEAYREVAVVSGEPANLRGYPPSTASAIASLCERAGPGSHDMGDITAVYTVLVAGSDMEEPVADMLRGVLDGHIVLDRAIAEQGRFPAIDVSRSVSRALPQAANRMENLLIKGARESIAVYDRSALMVQAGLYVSGSDPDIDAALECHDAIKAFLELKDKRDARAHYAVLKKALTPAGRAQSDTVIDQIYDEAPS